MVMVKKIMMSVGLAALVTTSTATLTMAQSYQPEVGSGNIVRKQGGPVTSQRWGEPFSDAYTYAKPAPHHRHVSHDRMERQ